MTRTSPGATQEPTREAHLNHLIDWYTRLAEEGVISAEQAKFGRKLALDVYVEAARRDKERGAA